MIEWHKNILDKTFNFDNKINCFVGHNGVGKTNILDSIYHLAIGKSSFSISNENNINHGSEFMLLDGLFSINDKEENITCSLKRNETKVFLVNTGWTGGGYGIGKRFPIPVTRAIINGIQDNKINFDNLTYLDKLNLYIPNELDGVDSSFLNPKTSWSSAEEYDLECNKLCERFKQNFKQFNVSQEIIDAGPK